MDQIGFGELVRALREEQRNPITNIQLSREALAEKAGLHDETLKRIESGKQLPKPDQLLAIANALELNAAERGEFIFAGSGIKNTYLVPAHHKPEYAMQLCLETLQRLYTPAFAIDPFSDVVATNLAAVHLYGLENQSYYEWRDLPYPINIIEFLFRDNPLGGPPLILGGDMDKTALNNVFNFRLLSLQFRARPYFKSLLERLSKLKDFGKYWERAKYFQGDTAMGEPFFVRRWNVRIVRSYITFPTAYGPLRIVTYSPIDEQSHRQIAVLMERAGMESFETSRWPEKPPYREKEQG